MGRKQKFELGDVVEDTVTGFTGTIMCVASYYNGCIRYIVQPRLSDKGNFRESETFDQERLMKVKPEKKIKPVTTPTGGDRADPKGYKPLWVRQC